MDVLLRVGVLPAVLRGLRDAAEVAATAAVNGADVTDAMQQLHVELSALRDRFYRDADADDACENDGMWFDQRAGLHVRALRGAVASVDRALVAASGAGCSSIMILATLLEICTYWRGSLDALLVLVEEATRSGGPSPTARQLLARAVQRRTFFSDAMLACVDGVPRGAEHAATMRQRWTTFITALTSVPDRVAAVHGHVAASGSQSQKAQRPLDRLPFFNHLAAAIVYALRKSTTSTMHLPLVAIAMEKLVRLGYAEQIALAIVEQFAARQRKVDLMHVMQSLAQRSQEQLLYKLIVQIRERLLDCPAVTVTWRRGK